MGDLVLNREGNIGRRGACRPPLNHHHFRYHLIPCRLGRCRRHLNEPPIDDR